MRIRTPSNNYFQCKIKINNSNNVHTSKLFVLHMRTLAIPYPTPWGQPATPNKENAPSCPGWGEVGASIDRCITHETVKVDATSHAH